MIDTITTTALAWLLTYLIHSTVLLGLAWALTRARPLPAAVLDLVWKTALVGGLVTATVQIGFEVRPAGSLSLRQPSEIDATTLAAPATGPSEAAGPIEHVQAPASPLVPAPSAVVAAPAAPAPVDLPLEAIVLGAWALVGLALGLSYAARRLILVGRIGDRQPVLDGRLLDELGRLTREAGLRRAPRLTSTERISSPIALGVAEICVPETALTDLDLEQQRSMLAHELAHLARRDPLWLAFASFVERVLWVQPLNRVARRQIATAAEYLCDEWAVRRTGSGVALARCIAQVAEWIQASPLGVPVAGMAEERSLLVSRVEKLLAARATEPRSRRVLVLGAAAVVVATTAIAPGVSRSAAARAADAVVPPFGIDADTQGAASRDSQASHESASAHGTDSATETGDPKGGEAESPPVIGGATSAQDRQTRDSAVVVALIARLKDESPGVRRAAASALGKLEDPRAVPGLISALRDAEPSVRAAAAEALGNFHDPRAINGLSALLTDTNRDVRKNALDALSEYESGVPASAILPLVKDADAELRHAAAHALGKFDDRSAGPTLATLVRDPSPEVRGAAIESLAHLHDVSHSSAIAPALGDPNAEVRHQALEALHELRASIPEATLLALLRDGNAAVRAKAAEVAGDRRVIAAIPSLRRMVDDANDEVRQQAVEALSELPDDSALDALRAALNSKDANVRREAAEALGERRQ